MAEISEKEAILGFMDSMKKAASYAGMLAHYQQNPQWMTVRHFCEQVNSTAIDIATSKALSRNDVVRRLDLMGGQK